MTEEYKSLIERLMKIEYDIYNTVYKDKVINKKITLDSHYRYLSFNEYSTVRFKSFEYDLALLKKGLI